LYKDLFEKIAKIIIKRHVYSIDEDDDDFDIWMMNRLLKFHKFPTIIPDRDIVWRYNYNIYKWFKSEFRQYDNEIVPEMLFRLYKDVMDPEMLEDEIVEEIRPRQYEAIENEIENEEITEEFSDEVDEEAKEPVTCKVCFVNTPKVVFISCNHCACFGCADKLKDHNMCRKTISKKIKIFL